jgi:poly(3-hydroxybutyrate) depolymerase
MLRTRYFLLLFFFSVGLFTATAQNPGCDGQRYKQDLFQSVQKTSVPYATAIGHTGQPATLVMDVYEPEGDTTSMRPVVILEHGGSFIFGDKTDMTRWCLLLAKKGYVAVSIQYRLYPVFVLGYPDSTDIMDTAIKAVGDMKAAVRYFREDAETANQFRADPAHIFIGGYSAGAVAALHAAFLDDDDMLPSFIQTLVDANGGLNGNSGSATNQTYSSAISAVVNMSGGLYRREWITNGEVPMSNIHGTADATVPFLSGLAANIAYLEGSGLLHPQALSVDNWSYLEKVIGGGHTNIYDATQYADQLDNYWLQTTALLESLTCYSDSLPILVSSPEITSAKKDWFVYPNPAAQGQALAIRLPEAVNAVTAVLYDISGREIQRTENIQNGQAALWTTKLVPGIYFVKIATTQQPSGFLPGTQRLLIK